MTTPLTPIDVVRCSAPERPVFCFRPARLKAAADWFLNSYPAIPFYAVKANPAAHVLDALWAAGIRDFDVASDTEARLIAERFPDARMAFLHPVKNRNSISRAYHDYGCRIFVLDTKAELDKILAATGQADDLTLIVRIAVSNEGAALPLSRKFGAGETDAPALLRQTRRAAQQLGISFHVGSQAMNPGAWATAMSDLSRIIVAAGVTVDIADIGGGFPGIYADSPPPALDVYADIATRAFEDMLVLETAQLWCEPGRALVSECESLLTRIEAVRNDALYLNDGSFGALYDAIHERWKFPLRAISSDGRVLEQAQAYTLYGPTCDSADRFPEPVWLPGDLQEGDYLEFGNIGAYGRAMAGGFNGFGVYESMRVHDAPWPTLYPEDEADIISLETGTTV